VNLKRSPFFEFPLRWIGNSHFYLNFLRVGLNFHTKTPISTAVNLKSTKSIQFPPRCFVRLQCQVCKHRGGFCNSSAKFLNTTGDFAIMVRSLKTPRWIFQLKCEVLKHHDGWSNYSTKFWNTAVDRAITM